MSNRPHRAMTEQEQRRAIAEWCGWKWKDSTETAFGATQPLKKWHDPEGTPQPWARDYLHDLNAMHEADCTMDTLDQLMIVVCGIKFPSDYKWQRRDVIALTKATAAQRAEALLRTIGRWKDS